MDGQLRELLTNYGPSAVSGLTACGTSRTPNWHLEKNYGAHPSLQPAALIIPNHHQTPKPGEDVQTFERDIPGQNPRASTPNM